MNKSASEILRTGLMALGVTAAAAVLFHGLDIVLGTRLFFTHDISRSDIWHLHYPMKHFYATGLRECRLPLWCPGIGTGFPLHAEGQVGALYPVNLLLFGLLPLELAFNWGILLHVALAGTFTAMFAREVGAGRGGSILSGVVFAFCGFLVTHLKHINMTAAAVWAPLLLLLLERYTTHGRRRTLAGFGLAVGAMILAGHPQIWYDNLVVAGCYSLFLVFRKQRTAGLSSVGRLAGGILAATCLGILVGLAQILPTAELTQQGPRNQGLTYEEATEWEYVPGYLTTFFLPYRFGDPGALNPTGFKPAPGTKNFFWEITGYVGLLPLLLALAALGLGIRSARVWLLAGMVGVSLLVTLGKHGGLVYILYHALPGFSSFRFHDRFLQYVDLGLAVLAGIGLTRILRSARPVITAAATAAVLALCFLDLHLVLADHNPTIESRRWTALPRSLQRIRQEESGSGEPFRIACFDRPHFVFLNAYRHAHGWKGDLSPYDIAREMVYPDLNLLYGFESLDFYHPLHPDEMLRVLELFHAPDLSTGIAPNMTVASLYNVRYILTPFKAVERHVDLEHIAVFPGSPDVLHGTNQAVDVHLFRNRKALPRAFLVPEAVQVRGEDAVSARRAVLHHMTRPGFDPRRRVLLPWTPGDPEATGLGPGEAIPHDRVRFLHSPPDEVLLEVDAPGDCWLFLSETAYPGWSAEVDGKEATIHPANLGGRAVRISRGKHRVRFSYDPASFTLGAIASLLGLAGLCFLFLSGRKRTPSPE